MVKNNPIKFTIRPNLEATLVLTLLILSTSCLVVNTDEYFEIHLEEGKHLKTSSSCSSTRYANRIVEDFSTMDNISMSNTTVQINTFNKKALLRGMGTPKSNIRSVTNPDHTVAHNGFNAMAVDENGRYYHLNAGSGTTVEIFNDWTDYFNSRPNIGTLNVPESQHSTQMFVANSHLYTSSESSQTLRKVRLHDGVSVNSNINHALTSRWGWRGPNQQGVACDGAYIYTWSDTTLKIWDLNENLIRTVNGLPNKNGYGTCFAVGHYFYCVDYSQAAITHRVDADTGTVHAYTNEVFISNSYVVDASYDYFHNRLFTGRGWRDTYAIDNVAYTWGNLEGFTNGTVQSTPLHNKLPTIGAAKITWFESTPTGTDIVYNMTLDGEHWVTMQNNTEHIFEHRGSRLMWNATLTTNDQAVTPSIDQIIIEYDLFSDPEPYSPVTDLWHGNSTPTLKWNFTDPDNGDHQSDYLVEIFNDTEMNDQVYNSSWVNSTRSEHTVKEELMDSHYYWRVRTRDAHLVASNYSFLKRFKLDTIKPVGNITILGGEFSSESTNNQLVTLSINAFDNSSGVDKMQLINDKNISQQWEPFKTEKGFSLDPVDGPKTIGVRFRDHAGIISDVFHDTIYLDYLGPGDINVSSSTHPNNTQYYCSTEPVFEWEKPLETTLIKGYAYMVDQGPSSEPYKNIPNPPNPSITSTWPGEFTALKDGTWYFHISACDVYDQWSNTTHFQFNIDSTTPIATSFLPTSGSWQNGTEVDTSVVFRDENGLDLETIEYSFRTSSEGDFSPWRSSDVEVEILETGTGNNPLEVKATILLDVSEGTENVLRWRISDLAGNGPVVSEDHLIQVDNSPVYFENPSPAENEWSNDMDVECSITVLDNGSGVAGNTIEYSTSFWGDADEYFRNWTAAQNMMEREVINVFLSLEFPPGKHNYIQWRAMDCVGNGYEMSEKYRVWVNSEPEAKIYSPGPDMRCGVGERFLLDGNGSMDNEDDELTYLWKIKDANTKKIISDHEGKLVEIQLDTAGEYYIYLNVVDGHGLEDQVKVKISVGAIIGDGNDENNGQNINENDNNDPGMKNNHTLPDNSYIFQKVWMVGLVLFLIIILVVVVLLVRRRRKKKIEPDIQDYGKTGAPFYRPQNYVAPVTSEYQPYYNQPQHRMTQAGMTQAGMTQAGMTQAGMTQAGMMQDIARTPLPPFNNWPTADDSTMSTPNYQLPTFSTTGGEQNLNTMALPPAPSDSIPPNDRVLSNGGTAASQLPPPPRDVPPPMQ